MINALFGIVENVGRRNRGSAALLYALEKMLPMAHAATCNNRDINTVADLFDEFKPYRSKDGTMQS